MINDDCFSGMMLFDLFIFSHVLYPLFQGCDRSDGPPLVKYVNKYGKPMVPSRKMIYMSDGLSISTG